MRREVRVVERPWGLSVGISAHLRSISSFLPEVERGVGILVSYVPLLSIGVARGLLCIASCMAPKMWRALGGRQLARCLSYVALAFNGRHDACLIERHRCGHEKMPPEQYLNGYSWTAKLLPRVA